MLPTKIMLFVSFSECQSEFSPCRPCCLLFSCEYRKDLEMFQFPLRMEDGGIKYGEDLLRNMFSLAIPVSAQDISHTHL